jgi:hypothetical protein
MPLRPCKSQHATEEPLHVGIYTFSYTSLQLASGVIYNIQFKDTRCGAVFSATFAPVLMVRVKCLRFGGKATYISPHLPPAALCLPMVIW